MAAELRVRIDWGDTGNFDAPKNPVTDEQMCDVSDHLISVRYDMGMSSITRGFTAGKAVVELTNDDDRYSPWNRFSILDGTGSPLVPEPSTTPAPPAAGYLRPGHRVEISVLDGATVYRRFTGWVERLSVRGGRGESRTCTIYAVDVLALMQHEQISLAMQTDITAADLINLVLDAAPFVAAKTNTWFTFDVAGAWNGFDVAPLWAAEDAYAPRSIDDMGDVIAYAWWDDTTLRAALDDIMTAMGASYYADGSGTIIVHNRYYEHSAARAIGAGGKGVGTWAAQHTLQAEVLADEQEMADADVANIVKVASQAYKPQAAPSTLWALEDAQVPIEMQPGEYVPLRVSFTAPASVVTTPVATTDYLASANSDGSGADLTANLAPNFVAYGASAAFNLQNTGAVALFIRKLQIRGTAMDTQQAMQDERLDHASRMAYHQRDLAISSPLIQSRDRAASLATQVILSRASARATPKIHLLNDQSAAILGAQLGDSVEVRYDDGTWDLYVGDPEDAPSRYRRYHLWGVSEAIRPTMPAGIDIESTWTLVEALVQAGGRDFFRFDVGPGFDRGILIW